jgi:hypothetical protein
MRFVRADAIRLVVERKEVTEAGREGAAELDDDDAIVGVRSGKSMTRR